MSLPPCAHVCVVGKTRRPWRGERTIVGVVESPSAPQDVLVAVEPLSVHVVEVQPLSAHAAVVVVAELVVVVSDDLFHGDVLVVVVSDDLPVMTF